MTMYGFVQSVMLATYYEHKARTGHDAFDRNRHLSVFCDTCLHLGAALRDSERIEEEDMKKQAQPGRDLESGVTDVY